MSALRRQEKRVSVHARGRQERERAAAAEAGEAATAAAAAAAAAAAERLAGAQAALRVAAEAAAGERARHAADLREAEVRPAEPGACTRRACAAGAACLADVLGVVQGQNALVETRSACLEAEREAISAATLALHAKPGLHAAAGLAAVAPRQPSAASSV